MDRQWTNRPIRPTKSDKIPDRIIALGTALTDMPARGKMPACRRLDCAHAIAFRVADPRSPRVATHTTTCPATWWRWLYSRLYVGTHTWIIGLGVYDAMTCLGLWNEIEAGNLEAEPGESDERPHAGRRRRWSGIIIGENPPTIIQLRYATTHGLLTIVDTANYGVQSLEQLSRGESRCEISAESEMHVAIGRATWTRRWVVDWCSMLRREKLGAMQMTAASQALYSLRRHHLAGRPGGDKPCIMRHGLTTVAALERDSLFSGRCEAARIGLASGPIYHLDVRSMYPWVMAHHPLPVELLSHNPAHAELSAPEISDGDAMIADVTLDTNEPLYPLRVLSDDRLSLQDDACRRRPGARPATKEVIWPVGTFRTVLAWPELQVAIKLDHVKAIHRWALYRTAMVCRDWAKHVYQLRQDMDQAERPDLAAACQAMLQSLAGKFGQRRHQWETVHDWPPPRQWGTCHVYHPELDDVIQYRFLAGTVKRCMPAGESAHSWPALSAFVTSYARVHLMRIIRQAGTGHVHYWDTDSVWVDQVGHDNLVAADLVRQGELGRLSLKGTYDHVAILGIKHYIADGRRVCAGVSPGTPLGADVQLCQPRLAAPMEAAAVGRCPDAKLCRRWLQLRRQYRHGQVMPDGTVRPWLMVEP